MTNPTRMSAVRVQCRWLALLACVTSAPSFAEIDFPHLSTTGYGEVTAEPDMAKFTVTVVESMLTAEQAKQAVDQVVSDFLKALGREEVPSEQIQSSNLYLSPQYQYPKNGAPELVGYRATRTIQVTVNELEKLNDYLDLALSVGINQVSNIELKVKEAARYQDQARQAAIRDANQKAHALSEGFGKTIKGVWRIDYRSQQNQPVLMRTMSMDAKRESVGYQDSSIIIRDSVDVIYQID